MAAVNVETRVAILLSPFELGASYKLLESLHIRKSQVGVDYNLFALHTKELNKSFPYLPPAVKELLSHFGADAVEKFRNKLSDSFQNSKLTSEEELMLLKPTLKHFHQLFERLKPFTGLVKWYHRSKVGNGKSFKTSPAYFSNYKPLLKFHVAGEASKLVLKTEIVVNGASYNLNEFSRYHFFLENNNEFFLLSYKDYQTLEWLSGRNWSQLEKDPVAFSENILSKLDTNYSVNRNDFFTKTQINSVPVNRLLLSELNGSFLMLTPQWVYEGFVLENPWKQAFETVMDGEVVEIIRNKEVEDEFVKLLTGLHPNFGGQRNGYFYLSFAEAQKKQWFLKAYHHLLELGIQLVGMDLLNHFRYSPDRVETVTEIKEEVSSKVLLKMKVSFGKENLPLNELQKMLLAGQKAVLLKDGSLGILDDVWIRNYSAIIKHGKISGDEIEISRSMAISEQAADGERQVLKSLMKEQWWQKWQQWQNTQEKIYELPDLVKADLRPYQQKGFEWLTLLSEAGSGGCLADDMGLGKTLQTICFLAYYIQQNPRSVNIIVCPSSLIYNWQQELEKFTPAITSVVYHGATRNADELFTGSTQVIITSYGTVRADATTLLANQYGVAVIDESHNIKNPSAQITGVINMISAINRIALSGTPVVNNTFDLYSQLNFAVPGMFGSREFFKREYADAIDRDHDEEKIRSLQKLTAPFILRRTKEQVAKDLPEKTEMILWCRMHTRQQDLYNNIKDRIRGSIFLDIKQHGLNKSKLAVLQGMLKLRQVCNSPLLLPVDEQEECVESVKTEMLIGELKNILKEHKAIVFSQFSSMLHLLAEECNRQDIAYYHFDGQTPPAKRIEMVNEFQLKDNAVKLFLISLKAGNTGLTLTEADYVFLFDPWWNTAVEQQAIDRTHRIGQTKNVFAYKIICKDTIEEKIVKLQQRKKKLAEDLVGGDDGFVKALSEEDINYLFS